MRTIFLIMIGLSVAWSQNIGIVHDSKTGLDWQDDYSDNGDNVKYGEWTEAINYCEALSLGGHDDWRLPNINEQKSVIEKTNYYYFSSTRLGGFSTSIPYYDPADYFERDYWSSTIYAKDSNPSKAWFMEFTYGFYNINSTHARHYVRCVREGQ